MTLVKRRANMRRDRPPRDGFTLVEVNCDDSDLLDELGVSEHYEEGEIEGSDSRAVVNLPEFRWWEAEVKFRVNRGRREIEQLTIRPWGDPRRTVGGITTELLRCVRLGEIQREVDRLLSGVVWPHAGFGEGFRDSPRPGRRGRSDVEYAEIAAVYVSKLNEPNPTVATATELEYSPSAVGSMLHKARRRGLLTPSPPGQAGGELTRKARELLAQKAKLSAKRERSKQK